MYPAFQTLINKDFNELNQTYPNMIQNQHDLNHLFGLYYSSYAIYQYMQYILPPNSNLNTVLALHGNEAKYNSQIGVYEKFCIHIMYFYSKNLNTKSGNMQIQNNPDVEGINYRTDIHYMP